jgi:hypothetical protein
VKLIPKGIVIVKSAAKKLILLNKIKNMNKNLLFLALLLSSSVFSQNKHALVVAVGDYPYVKERAENWSDLSSKNDVDLVTKMLKDQHFTNVDYLLDSSATVPNVCKAFEKLISRLQPKDVVYFHYSGHGQRIKDMDGKKFKRANILVKDEPDGFDEALVLYHAPLKWENGYEYEHHFADDQMKFYLDQVRKKVGGQGQVVVVIDACHSGTATRGSDQPNYRGTGTACAPPDSESSSGDDPNVAFGTDFDYQNTAEMGKMTAFFGCKSSQVNREYKPDKNADLRYGSLTYFLINGMTHLGENASYSNLFDEIKKNMIIEFKNEQHPEIEGDNLELKIFSGSFVPQDPFFTINKLYGKEVEIAAGIVNGVAIGDSIGLYDITVNSPKGAKPISTGVITEVRSMEAVAKMNASLEGESHEGVKYRVFKTFNAATGAQIRMKVAIGQKGLKSEIMKRLEKEPNIQVVESDYNYLLKDTTIGGVKNKLIVMVGSSSSYPLRNMSGMTMTGPAQYDSIVTILKDAGKVDLFRKLEASDYNIDFNVRFLDKATKQPISEDLLRKMPEGTAFLLEVENIGNDPFYFNWMDIEPGNKTSLNAGVSANRLIDVGRKVLISVQIAPPFGMEQFKFIATSSTVDFSSFQNMGSEIKTRGTGSSALENFIGGSIQGTRGFSSSEELGTTIKTHVFEITPKQ